MALNIPDLLGFNHPKNNQLNKNEIKEIMNTLNIPPKKPKSRIKFDGQRLLGYPQGLDKTMSLKEKSMFGKCEL